MRVWSVRRMDEVFLRLVRGREATAGKTETFNDIDQHPMQEGEVRRRKSKGGAGGAPWLRSAPVRVSSQSPRVRRETRPATELPRCLPAPPTPTDTAARPPGDVSA
jgi:hypothetical protein